MLLDGQEIMSALDPTFAWGGMALYSSANAGSFFDDILVRPL